MKQQLPILVVDSQDSMRRALSVALQGRGFDHILQAANGVEAMRILRSTPVAAVISDWNMAGMSGLGLLRWVRSEPSCASLPFLLIIAEPNREQVRTATAAGASAYLIKPYTAHDLANKMKRIVGGEYPHIAVDACTDETVLGLANTTGVEQRIGELTVLVVDDMPATTDVICDVLHGEYAVLVAHSGHQALELARSDTPPDLILLDVMMPEMDGFEICSQLKADPATRDIPIIFLTGKDDVDHIIWGLEIGGVDYIAKPAEPSVLKARIRTHLRLKLAFADLARQNAGLAASAKLREDVERITQHDLKNPITAIIAGTEMLLGDDGLAGANAEMLQLIQGEAWRVMDLVDRSLNLYRMETGSFVLQPEPVDLALTLAMVRQEAMTSFMQGLDIRFRSGDGSDVTPGRYLVLGEPGLCHSLFGNLLKNAAEASPQGAPIDVHFVAEAGAVRIIIRNDGMVPAAIRERFFDKYVTAGKAGGTGLGTYSAKLVTEAQRGTIAMNTDAVTGTTLTVRLLTT